MTKYRALSEAEIQTLASQGCTAADWSQVQVAEDFDPLRVRQVQFFGKVKLGAFVGSVAGPQGLPKPAGIYNAIIIDCTVGDNTRIANVGVHLANLAIGSDVCIENVGCIQCSPGAAFGNGVEVEVLNEGDGREVVLFNELSVQYAYIMCLYRYRAALVRRLTELACAYADKVRRDTAPIGDGAKICSVDEMIDVAVGPAAVISGAASLRNGTILSAPDAATTVGAAVTAKDFIIAEAAQVTDGVTLARTYVGQGVQMGKQYSAENSLFFANSEAFHGEACSVFAGPYTVTHHKSSLLIAGLFSFYNAGSGTNQSNHMYKLGPVHEGRLGRGTKTGSFSYMMWPCCVGPFGVVLGKHSSNFDTSEFPFSHHEARSDGKCLMVPGLNLVTVGTVRDGAKWPSRDRRRGQCRRDLINFAVFSPYTVGKMMRATARLKTLQEQTDKSIEEVSVGGALVRRPILRTGQKFYRTGIELYLLEQAFTKARAGLTAGRTTAEIFAAAEDAVYDDRWVDVGGLLTPKARLDAALNRLEKIEDATNCAAVMESLYAAYDRDAWAWVLRAYQEVFGVDLTRADAQALSDLAENYRRTRSKFLNLVIADAEKEFDELSHTGFGWDGAAADVAVDFQAVRGEYDSNKFVKEMRDALAALEREVADFRGQIEKMQ